MTNRRYLDETSYLSKEGKIHFLNEHGYELIPDKNRQGKILPARSWQRKLTDEIAGSVKAQLKGDIPVSPYLAYPAAAFATIGLFNPITTAKTIAKGIIGSNAVNTTTKLVTNKNWGELIGDWLDINADVAEFTNPGYGLGGVKTRRFLRNSVGGQNRYKIAKNFIDTGKIPENASN